MNEDYKPRFSFEVTEAQRQRADRLLTAHGVNRAVFSPILDDVLDKIEQHGEKFIIAITVMAKPSELLPSIKLAEDVISKLEVKDGQPR